MLQEGLVGLIYRGAFTDDGTAQNAQRQAYVDTTLTITTDSPSRLIDSSTIDDFPFEMIDCLISYCDCHVLMRRGRTMLQQFAFI